MFEGPLVGAEVTWNRPAALGPLVVGPGRDVQC